MPPDRVEQLTKASGLAASSRTAVISAWDALLATAREKWPTVTFDEDVLVEFIGPRLSGDDLPAALTAAPAADLAMAAACAAQDKTAHAAFDSVLTEVDAAGASTNATKDLVTEVKQLLRVQLLVPRDDKPPGIVGYRGKGPLRGWVRITATRELIRHKKKQKREAPLADRTLDHLLTSNIDPGLAALKAEYRAEFAVALREAIEDLNAEDRTLLRQQIVDGLSIDAIGAAFGVHRATAARWLNRARGALVAATHVRLAARLKLPVEQIESVIRLVSSQLDASVIRYLRDGKQAQR
ncbi:MAG TPA: sigma factor-like helix-turn-helix DNA-binding protein [Kofleriaceae bacterium]|nr:sigma factor-like helix-turn-helix DNA-binding protein [Kofleriaceae bacterium]